MGRKLNQEEKMHHHDELFDIHFAQLYMLAREGCSLEPKLFPCYHIMCKQITLHCVYNERLLVKESACEFSEMGGDEGGKRRKGAKQGEKKGYKKKG